MDKKLIEQEILYIKGNEIAGIADFSCDVAKVCKEHQDELIRFQYDPMKYYLRTGRMVPLILNLEKAYELIGIYDWIALYCPNRRVVHLMRHGRRKRTRYKNFNRALHILSKLVNGKEK